VHRPAPVLRVPPVPQHHQTRHRSRPQVGDPHRAAWAEPIGHGLELAKRIRPAVAPPGERLRFVLRLRPAVDGQPIPPVEIADQPGGAKRLGTPRRVAIGTTTRRPSVNVYSWLASRCVPSSNTHDAHVGVCVTVALGSAASTSAHTGSGAGDTTSSNVTTGRS